VFKIVAGVLHFGNVKFRVEKKANEDEGSSISNPELITHAAKMWGINAAEIQKYLCSRNIGSKEAIIVSLNVSQALDTRDAMTKRVYSELFQFVVNKINLELSSTGKKRHRFIGVLDIFGFESFEVIVYSVGDIVLIYLFCFRQTPSSSCVLTFVTRNFSFILTNTFLKWSKPYIRQRELIFPDHHLLITRLPLICLN